jgi:hypothetical protein
MVIEILCNRLFQTNLCKNLLILFFFFTEVRGAASNSAYYGYPELWILRYPAQRYHAVPSSGFEPTTLIVFRIHFLYE